MRRVSDSLLGTVVGGHYRIESVLGQGGMCTVYRAVGKGKHVAVKVLAGDSARDPELGRRFQREITTGRRIQHPNVVAILDDGEIADGRFLVMELLDGKSLSAVLAHGRLSTVRSVAVARQILAGLGAAHELGIAHRDVKPDNIFLVGDHVKILDFGIASNERAAEKLTAAGVAFGTPEYISPEMAMGLPTDARSDVYAAGVVLFQMLTGRPAVPACRSQSALARACTGRGAHRRQRRAAHSGRALCRRRPRAAEAAGRSLPDGKSDDRRARRCAGRSTRPGSTLASVDRCGGRGGRAARRRRLLAEPQQRR